MAKLNLENGQVKIFKNDFKEDGTKQPDYNGGLSIDGKEYNIALWVSTSKSGLKYFSGKVQELTETASANGFHKTNDLPF